MKPDYIPASSRQYKDETDDIVQSFNKYKTTAFGQAPSKVFREIQNVESLNAGDYARWTDRSVTDDEIIPKNRKALCVTSPAPTESDKIINPLKADYSKLNTFYDKSLEKINNMEMQMIKLERQLKESLLKIIKCSVRLELPDGNDLLVNPNRKILREMRI